MSKTNEVLKWLFTGNKPSNGRWLL